MRDQIVREDTSRIRNPGAAHRIDEDGFEVVTQRRTKTIVARAAVVIFSLVLAACTPFKQDKSAELTDDQQPQQAESELRPTTTENGDTTENSDNGENGDSGETGETGEAGETSCTADGGTFDATSGTCEFSDAVDQCDAEGSTFDDVVGECVFTPAPHHAAMGIWPPGPATVDPPGGQGGSNKGPWSIFDAADIAAWSAWRTDITGPAFDQQIKHTSFPCGAVTDTYRVHCPVGAAELAPGEFLVVAMTLVGAIEPVDARLQYGLAFDGGGADNYLGRAPFELDLFNDTELWYRLEIAPDGTRVMYADGFRDGTPNFPRHSSALVIEYADTIVWVIPASELPATELAYRVTSFRNEGTQLEPPDPSKAGGDVSGLDVSELQMVPADVVVAELGPDVPPDTPAGQERLPAPPDDGQTLLVTELIANLEDRWNKAFASGEVDPVLALIHPIATLNSADGCRSFVERTFPGAQRIELSWIPDDAIAIGGIAGYTANAAVAYPTGTNEFPISVAVGNSGQLAPVFSCDL